TFVCISIFLLETLFAVRGAVGRWPVSPAFDFNRTVIRAIYLTLSGWLLGFFAEQEKVMRAEGAATAHLLQQPSVRLVLARTLSAVGSLLGRMFDARVVVFAVRELGDNRAFLWTIDAGRARAQELTLPEEAVWLFVSPVKVWAMELGHK